MTVFVKIALLATQVSCPESKRVDNFSRFVTKGDIQLLKGKKYQCKVVDAEKNVVTMLGHHAGQFHGNL